MNKKLILQFAETYFLVHISFLLSVFTTIDVKAGSEFHISPISNWPRPYWSIDDNIRQYHPKIVSNGNSFAITWYEKYYETSLHLPQLVHAYASRISADGELLDPNGILIEDRRTNVYGDNQRPSIVSVGEDYWVFYGHYSLEESYHAKILSQEGDLSEPFKVGEGVGYASISGHDVAYMPGGNVIVVWMSPTSIVEPTGIRNYSGIFYSLLTEEGELVVDSAFTHNEQDTLEHLSVAVSGSTFLVVYNSRSSLKAIRIDSEGNVLDTEPIYIDAASDSGDFLESFDVIAYEDGWLVVYGRNKYSIFGRKVRQDGSVSPLVMIIDKPFDLPSWVTYGISIVEADYGFQIGWSTAYSNNLSDAGSMLNQFTSIYHLNNDLNLICQDVIEEPNNGIEVQLCRNDNGRHVGIWGHMEYNPNANITKQTLLGGVYEPYLGTLPAQYGYNPLNLDKRVIRGTIESADSDAIPLALLCLAKSK